MPVGYPTSKGDIDSAAGGLALTIRNAFEAAINLKTYIDSQTDVNLTALGYTAADVANLRSALIDLNNLGAVYRGEAAPPQTDYRRFAKFLTGVA
jgi:hypothetical protein